MSVLQLLLEKGLPSREVQVASNVETGDMNQSQFYHDNLNLNGNLQVDKQDVSDANPLPIQLPVIPPPTRTAIVMLENQLNQLYITGSNESQEGRQIFTGSKYIVRIHIACKVSSNNGKTLYFMDTATPLTRTLTGCVVTTCAPNKMSNEVIECGFRVQNGLSVWATEFGFYYKLVDFDGVMIYPDPANIQEGMCITVVVED
jgi:hypothetical protein